MIVVVYVKGEENLTEIFSLHVEVASEIDGVAEMRMVNVFLMDRLVSVNVFVEVGFGKASVRNAC